MTSQCKIALFSHIRSLIISDHRVSSVCLVGSLANGLSDRFSDIDIRVDVTGYDNAEYFLQLPAILSEKFEILIADPAVLLLPDLYVYNFHLRNMPIFWQIDIQVYSDQHNPIIKTFESNVISRGLKLWVVYAKYMFRGLDIDAKTFNESIDIKIVGENNNEIMFNILKQLKIKSSKDQLDFVLKCEEELGDLNPIF